MTPIAVPVFTRGDFALGGASILAGLKGWRSPFKHGGQAFDSAEFTVKAAAANTRMLVRIIDSSFLELARAHAIVGTSLTTVRLTFDRLVDDIAAGTILYWQYEPADAAGVLGYPGGGAYDPADADPTVYREYYLNGSNVWTVASPAGNYRADFRLLRTGPFFTLPSNITAMVGIERCLYFDGIASAHSPSGYSCSIIGPKGQSRERGFFFTPVAGDIGTHGFKAKLFNPAGDLVLTRDFTITVVGATPKASAKNVLYSGDSLTAHGTMLATTQATLAALGPVVPTFVGSQRVNIVTADTITGLTEEQTYSNGGVTYTVHLIDPATMRIGLVNGANALPSSGVLTRLPGNAGPPTINFSSTLTLRHEGNNGKTFAWFAGSTSPYYNPSTSLLDIARYRSSNGIANPIDFVDHDYGINESYVEAFRTDSQIAADIASAKALAAAFLADNASCIQVFSLPSIGASASDGFATLSGALQSRAIYEANLFKLRWALLQAFDNGAYHANVRVGSAGGAIDRLYGYERRAMEIAHRIPGTADVPINQVHPYTPGYQQKGDAKTADLMAWL